MCAWNFSLTSLTCVEVKFCVCVFFVMVNNKNNLVYFPFFLWEMEKLNGIHWWDSKAHSLTAHRNHWIYWWWCRHIGWRKIDINVNVWRILSRVSGGRKVIVISGSDRKISISRIYRWGERYMPILMGNLNVCDNSYSYYQNIFLSKSLCFFFVSRLVKLQGIICCIRCHTHFLS